MNTVTTISSKRSATALAAASISCGQGRAATRRMSATTLWGAVWVFLMAGCEANHYEIQLRPDGNQIQRKLTCWRQRSGDSPQIVVFPEEELRRIAVAYEATVEGGGEQKKHEFTRRFTDVLPNDVGGSGTYTHWESSLGTVSVYVERFRGNDNISEHLARRQAAAGRLAELVGVWLTAELKDTKEFPTLRGFLQKDLGADLNNLCLYIWAYELTASPEIGGAKQTADRSAHEATELVVRLGQYLVEHDYFAVDELPELTRLASAASEEETSHLLLHAQRLIARKMGLTDDQPMPPSLGFLSNKAALTVSANEFLKDTPEYQRLLQQWQREVQQNPEAHRPEPLEVWSELVAQAYLPGLFGRKDQLSVELATDMEPFATNGRWDPESSQLAWSPQITAQVDGIPTLLYGLWSTPDVTTQTRLFGRVLLRDRELGAYCLWHRGLSGAEATEWDTYLASLRPHHNLAQRVTQFRFSQDQGDAAQDVASAGRELILEALQRPSD